MREILKITVRTATVVALVVCMPLLALPQVSARVDQWTSDLYTTRSLWPTKVARPNDTTLPLPPVRNDSQADDSVQWQAGRAEQLHESLSLRAGDPIQDPFAP